MVSRIASPRALDDVTIHGMTFTPREANHLLHHLVTRERAEGGLHGHFYRKNGIQKQGVGSCIGVSGIPGARDRFQSSSGSNVEPEQWVSEFRAAVAAQHQIVGQVAASPETKTATPDPEVWARAHPASGVYDVFGSLIPSHYAVALLNAVKDEPGIINAANASSRRYLASCFSEVGLKEPKTRTRAEREATGWRRWPDSQTSTWMWELFNQVFVETPYIVFGRTVPANMVTPLKERAASHDAALVDHARALGFDVGGGWTDTDTARWRDARPASGNTRFMTAFLEELDLLVATRASEWPLRDAEGHIKTDLTPPVIYNDIVINDWVIPGEHVEKLIGKRIDRDSLRGTGVLTSGATYESIWHGARPINPQTWQALTDEFNAQVLIQQTGITIPRDCGLEEFKQRIHDMIVKKSEAHGWCSSGRDQAIEEIGVRVDGPETEVAQVAEKLELAKRAQDYALSTKARDNGLYEEEATRTLSDLGVAKVVAPTEHLVEVTVRVPVKAVHAKDAEERARTMLNLGDGVDVLSTRAGLKNPGRA